jgi:hypothetical protein
MQTRYNPSTSSNKISHLYIHDDDNCVDPSQLQKYFPPNKFNSVELNEISGLNSLDILKGRLSDYPRFDLDLHGGYSNGANVRFWIKNKFHTSQEIFEKLVTITNHKPFILVVWGCYSYLTNDQLSYLPEGSIVRLHSSKKSSYYNTMIDSNLHQEYYNLQRNQFKYNFVEFYIKNLPVFLISTSTLIIKSQDKIHTFKAKPIIGPSDKHGLEYQGLVGIKYWEQQKKLFAEFLNTLPYTNDQTQVSIPIESISYGAFIKHSPTLTHLNNSLFLWLSFNNKFDKLTTFLSLSNLSIKHFLPDSTVLARRLKRLYKNSANNILHLDKLVKLVIDNYNISVMVDALNTLCERSLFKFFIPLSQNKLPLTLKVMKQHKVICGKFILFCLEDNLKIADNDPLIWAFENKIKLDEENTPLIKWVASYFRDYKKDCINNLYNLFKKYPYLLHSTLKSRRSYVSYSYFYALINALNDNILTLEDLNCKTSSEIDNLINFLKLLKIDHIYDYYYKEYKDGYKNFSTRFNQSIIDLLTSEKCLDLFDYNNLDFKQAITLSDKQLDLVIQSAENLQLSKNQKILKLDTPIELCQTPSDLEYLYKLPQSFLTKYKTVFSNLVHYGNTSLQQIADLFFKQPEKFKWLVNPLDPNLAPERLRLVDFPTRIKQFDSFRSNMLPYIDHK